MSSLAGVEAAGSTKLEQIGSAYYFDAAGGAAGTCPTLKNAGVNFYAGQLGGWMPIRVEKTSPTRRSSDLVTGSDQYAIWNTDNNGVYVSSAVSSVSGSNPALEAQ